MQVKGAARMGGASEAQAGVGSVGDVVRARVSESESVAVEERRPVRGGVSCRGWRYGYK